MAKIPAKMTNKNKSSRSYNKVLENNKSWKPLAVIATIIFGGSVAISVFAASPTAVAQPNPTPDCIYNKDAQSYNCSPSSTSDSGVSIVPKSGAQVNALTATPTPDMTKLTLNTSDEDKMVFNINQSRGSNNLATLTRNSCLDRAARSWSLDMANSDLINPPGSLKNPNLDNIITQECGSGSFSFVGGNVGKVDYSKYSDPSQILFNAWINDYANGNRATILNSRFQMVGVGSYRNSVTKNMWLTVLYLQCPGACNQATTISSYN